MGVSDSLTWRELTRWGAIAIGLLFLGGEYRDFKRTMEALSTVTSAQEKSREVDVIQSKELKTATEATIDHEARVRGLEKLVKELQDECARLSQAIRK